MMILCIGLEFSDTILFLGIDMDINAKSIMPEIPKLKVFMNLFFITIVTSYIYNYTQSVQLAYNIYVT